MDIRDLNPESYVDLFGDATQAAGSTPKFGAESTDQNIFESVTPTTTSSTTDTTTVAASTDQSTTETTTADPNNPVEADILAGTDKTKPGRKPKYTFEDARGYFEDRIKSQKFVAIEETLEDGSTRPFIPSNPEEFDEVIDIQVNYKLEQERKNLIDKVYKSKSPAWQAVLKYSEYSDDPADVLPFIQGVKNIDSVSDINENEIDGAERIIRIRMEQRGDTEDIISEQIESLKTTDKLVSTAQKYKPIILAQEKQNLAKMMKQKEQEEEEFVKFANKMRESAIKAIESPIFGKQKLKQEEKAQIFELIGSPDEETRGYPIFEEIDNLFANEDFQTLTMIALLLKNKDSFINYISTGAADKTASSLQRQLRVAGDNRAASGNDSPEDQIIPRVNRNQYNQPRFGRQ